MKQEQNKQEKESKNYIRFTGRKGGSREDEEGNMYITVGVYTGNLWDMAMQQTRCHENKDYASNSMLVSCMASYNLPIQLAPLFYEADFEVEEDGLHAKFTFKDAETRQLILDCMKAQGQASDIIMEFDKDYYINRSEVDLYRLKENIKNTFENLSWFIKLIQQPDTVIQYQYRDEGLDEENREWTEILTESAYLMSSLIELYESAGGEENLWVEEE